MLINRNFRLLLLGQAVSLIGDVAFDTTLLLWLSVVLLGGDASAPAVSSLLLALMAAVTIVVAPVAGVFVDRWDKRRTMLRADLIRAGLIGVVTVLALLPAGSLSRPTLIALITCAIASSTATSQFFGPARFVLISDVVPSDHQGRASSHSLAMGSFAGIVGPPLAALLLFAAGPAWAFGLNAVSFLASYAAIRAVRVPDRADAAVPTATKRAGSVRDELLGGLRFLAGSSAMRALLTAVAVASLGAGSIRALDVYFVQENLHAEPVWFGYLGGVFGVGALIGALAGGRAGDRWGHVRVFRTGLFLFGALFAGYSRVADVASAVVFTALFSVALGALNAAAFPLIRLSVPRAYLGRFMSVFHPVNRLAILISLAVSGALSTTVLHDFHATVGGVRFGRIDTIFMVSGALIVAAAVYAGWALRAQHRAPTAPADAPAAEHTPA